MVRIISGNLGELMGLGVDDWMAIDVGDAGHAAHAAQTAHPSTGSVPTISMPKPEIPT
jgi:hypothetical protein